MKVDLLYSARNRRAFTADSLEMLGRNTNWHLVRNLYLYDDLSTDGTRDLLVQFPERIGPGPEKVIFTFGEFGGPVAIMNSFLANSDCEVFAKIDNDVMVPSGWLDACVSVMSQSPELDLLGIEPPASRTPAPWAKGQAVAKPEHDAAAQRNGYARCEAIGGIGLMRTRGFRRYPHLRPFNIYGGFTNWQTDHRDIVKGWIVPPLPVFLLDRLPMAPYVELSKMYIEMTWQRPWTNYSQADSALWAWWQGVAA